MNDDTLPMWVIYDHPKDFPDQYVARQWLIERGHEAQATANVLTAFKLDFIRANMVAMGLTCLQPMPDDDPNIVEVWL